MLWEVKYCGNWRYLRKYLGGLNTVRSPFPFLPLLLLSDILILFLSVVLTIHPQNSKSPIPMTLQNKVQGQDKGIMLNGMVVATVTDHSWHRKREDYINVAAGMDLGVAVGVAVARFDNQRQKRGSAGATAGAAGGGGC